jgi:hypothetical protein
MQRNFGQNLQNCFHITHTDFQFYNFFLLTLHLGKCKLELYSSVAGSCTKYYRLLLLLLQVVVVVTVGVVALSPALFDFL